MKDSTTKNRVQHWAEVSEIIASLAIVVTLLVLVQEIRVNTEVQDRQMQLDRFMNFTEQIIDSPQVADIWAKVKSTDGLEPLAEAYVDRYGLNPSEAVVWSRFVMRTLFIWQADFVTEGASESLESQVSIINTYPDLASLIRSTWTIISVSNSENTWIQSLNKRHITSACCGLARLAEVV